MIKEKENLSFAEISKRYNLSKTTVFKWNKKLEPAKKRHRKPTKIDMELLKIETGAKDLVLDLI
jgi:transposase